MLRCPEFEGRVVCSLRLGWRSVGRDTGLVFSIGRLLGRVVSEVLEERLFSIGLVLGWLIGLFSIGREAGCGRSIGLVAG